MRKLGVGEMMSVEEKGLLRERFEEYCKEDICVAFSGGVDSSLVLVMACEAAEKTGKRCMP